MNLSFVSSSSVDALVTKVCVFEVPLTIETGVGCVCTGLLKLNEDVDADGVVPVDLVKLNDGFGASAVDAVEVVGLLKLKLGVEPVSAGLLKLKLGAATEVESTAGLKPANELSGFFAKLNEGTAVRTAVVAVGSLTEATAGLEKLEEGADAAADIDAEPNAANGLGLLGADADVVAPNDANGFDAGVGAGETMVPDRLARGWAILRLLIIALLAFTTGSIWSRELSSSPSSYLSLVSSVPGALLDIVSVLSCIYTMNGCVDVFFFFSSRNI
jgi:hypothetical protein